jgi:hypothetical protein
VCASEYPRRYNFGFFLGGVVITTSTRLALRFSELESTGGGVLSAGVGGAITEGDRDATGPIGCSLREVSEAAGGSTDMVGRASASSSDSTICSSCTAFFDFPRGVFGVRAFTFLSTAVPFSTTRQTSTGVGALRRTSIQTLNAFSTT